MKTVRRSNLTVFARNPGTKWHYVVPSTTRAMCKFRGSEAVEISTDLEKPAADVCRNCRKYAFHFGWNGKQ